MAIDTSMYANFRMPDFVGAYQQGSDWRQKQEQLRKQKEQEQGMRGIYSMGADGKMTINQEALKNYSQINPEGAYKIHRDLDDARIKEQAIIDDRNYKRDMLAAQRAKQNEKSAELSSTEAKQLGLAQMGLQAEQQYQNATVPNDENDQTNSWEWIDNSSWAPAWAKSDKANQAGSAQAAWVEAYLRDASGAAIPPSERLAYAKDYFPRGGDSPQVVENKRILREQKMRNALVGGGMNPQQANGFQMPKATTQARMQAQTQQRPASGGFSNQKMGIPSANAAAPKIFKTNDIDWAD